MNELTKKKYPSVAQSFGITGIIILGMLVFSPAMVLERLIGQEAAMLFYYLLAIGIPFWIVYSIRKNRTNHRSFNLTIENKRIIPLAIVGTIALLFGIISPIGSSIPMPENVKTIFMDIGSQTGIFSFFLMVIAAPILEELIFRGIILDGMLEKYPPVKSIVISSVLFGLVHLNPWQFVTGFIIGLFAGWIYYKTRSLSFPIIIHASANLSGFLLRLGGNTSSVDDTVVQMYGGLTNLILAIVGSVVVLSICIYFLQKEFNRPILKMAAHKKNL